MDSVLAACIALTALSLIISTRALLDARHAKKESLRFLEWKASIVSVQSTPAPKPAGNLFIKGGSITIESPATTRDLNDLYKRIKDLQDKGLQRGD